MFLTLWDVEEQKRKKKISSSYFGKVHKLWKTGVVAPRVFSAESAILNSLGVLVTSMAAILVRTKRKIINLPLALFVTQCLQVTPLLFFSQEIVKRPDDGAVLFSTFADN